METETFIQIETRVDIRFGIILILLFLNLVPDNLVLFEFISKNGQRIMFHDHAKCTGKSVQNPPKLP